MTTTEIVCNECLKYGAASGNKHSGPCCFDPTFGKSDPVHHPLHYGGDTPHEVIKCLSAWGLESDALLWNTVKYIARSGKKGPALEDLKKARFYLDRRITELENKPNGQIRSA